MTIYYSQAAFPGIRQDATNITNVFRSIREGRDTLAATIKIPAGTIVGTGDILEFFTLGAGVDPLSVSLTSSDFFDDAAGTVNVGTDIDPDHFIAASTIVRSAGGRVRAENGGTPAFNAVWTTTVVPVKIRAAFPAVGTQGLTVGLAAFVDRFITLEMDFQLNKFRVPEVSLAYNYGN